MFFYFYWFSEVHLVVVLAAARIEEGDAAVIEVEADADAGVGHDGAPLAAVAPQVADHQHRALRGPLEQRRQTVGYRHHGQVVDPSGWQRLHDVGTPATGLQPGSEAGAVDDDTGLQMVGQPQAEAPHPARQPVVGVGLQRVVGIVGPVLIDDVAHEAIVGGRLYAEAAAMPYAAQPDDDVAQFAHSVGKITK